MEEVSSNRESPCYISLAHDYKLSFFGTFREITETTSDHCWTRLNSVSSFAAPKCSSALMNAISYMANTIFQSIFSQPYRGHVFPLGWNDIGHTRYQSRSENPFNDPHSKSLKGHDRRLSLHVISIMAEFSLFLVVIWSADLIGPQRNENCFFSFWSSLIAG